MVLQIPVHPSGPAVDEPAGTERPESTGRAAVGPALVGRSREIAFLWRSLELARHSAQVVQLVGEPWVGKTRLLAELACAARTEGWTVAVGIAQPAPPVDPTRLPGGAGPAADPAAPIVATALERQVARWTEESALRLDEATRHVLAGYFPSLAAAGAPAAAPVHCPTAPQRPHPRPDPAGAKARPSRTRTVRALRTLLETLAGQGGLVLILDDVHRADPTTLDLLGDLASDPPDVPLLVAAAHRASPTGDLLTARLGHGDGPAHRMLEVTPLADRELDRLIPAETGRLRHQLLLRDAAGVPGLLQALLSARDTGTPACQAQYSATDLVAGPPPVALRPVALDFRVLSAPAWQVACSAAVSGDPFIPEVVAAVARLPQEQVLCSLDELIAEGLVTPSRTRSEFRFRRLAVRVLVYWSAEEGWRRGAHKRAVTALRATRATSSAALLASHLEHCAPQRGGDVDVLLTGARESLFTAPARAARWLRQADRAGAGPRTGPLLGKALLLSGRLQEAAGVFAGHDGPADPGGDGPPPEALSDGPHRGAARYPDTGRAARPGLSEWYARTLRLLGRYPHAWRVLTPRNPSARSSGEVLEHAALVLDSAVHPGDQAEREDCPPCAQLLTGALEEVAPEVRAHALALLACGAGPSAGSGNDARAIRTAQRPSSAERYAVEAAELLDELPDHRLAGQLEALRWLAEAELRLERPLSASRHFRRALRLAVRYGQGWLLSQSACGLAQAGLLLGDHASAASYAEFAVEAARNTDSPALLAAALARQAGLARLRRGAAPDTEQPAEEALAAAQEAGGPWPHRVAELLGATEPEPSPGGALEALSQREFEVAELVSAGYTNQQIATRLQLSHKTVETYMGRIFRKLGIYSRAQVAHIVGRADAAGAGPAPRGQLRTADRV
ncbi:AAA family ATPase [Kitasatospora brasiliensis]|uniref:AAA family ATPase n=1 Tax=Kitasatospora brasiliensis TaxID=3058040 RepID=UPI00292F37F3|nr:AAA family ATPase [Kitasatospora sp. K002]